MGSRLAQFIYRSFDDLDLSRKAEVPSVPDLVGSRSCCRAGSLCNLHDLRTSSACLLGGDLSCKADSAEPLATAVEELYNLSDL